MLQPNWVKLGTFNYIPRASEIREYLLISNKLDADRNYIVTKNCYSHPYSNKKNGYVLLRPPTGNNVVLCPASIEIDWSLFIKS